MASDILSGKLPEMQDSKDIDIGDTFSFQSSLPEMDITDSISDGVDAIRDFTNMDDFGISGSNFHIQNPVSHVDDFLSDISDSFQNTVNHASDFVSDFSDTFQNPMSHVGELISDVSDIFADRPAPDFSLPEFSLDTSSFFPNQNDNSEHWMNAGFGTSDTSQYDAGSNSDSEEFHSENEESSWDDW